MRGELLALRLSAVLAAAGCGGTLDAGQDVPHGILPVDERNPVIMINDGWSDNWSGEYAALLATSGGPPLVGIIVNADKYWRTFSDNVAGWNNLVMAARSSGLTGIPDVTGVVVDGFPRTGVQAEAVKLLHDQILQLRAKYWGTPLGMRFRRPIFRITVLFVGEQTSIERQLRRGNEIRAHNEQVRRTGVGDLIQLRATDVDQELARNRYRTFKERTYEALTSLRRHFHYHFINADAPLAEVERSINDEFQYQSSLELGHQTYDIIHGIPLVSEVTRHARQELVRRLDSYEHATPGRFKEVASFIERVVVPVIVRHALAGRCVVETDNALFREPTSVDMLLDTLAERGYHALYEERRTPVPGRVDLKTGAIACEDRVAHAFTIHFHPPEIRRGH